MRVATVRFWRGSIRGSAILPALITTLGGATFALLYLNLARYVAASNAVEQAARKVARCLTPSDPENECVAYDQVVAPRKWAWSKQVVGETGEERANLVRYQGTMYRADWFADYTTYSIESETPRIGWTTFDVPVRHLEVQLPGTARFAEYSYRLNSPAGAESVPAEDFYVPAHPFARTVNSGGRLVTVQEEWFPAFDRQNVEDPDKDSSTKRWLQTPAIAGGAADRKFGDYFRALSISSAKSAVLSAGKTGVFESQRITIPALPGKERNPGCGLGYSCGVTDDAGCGRCVSDPGLDRCAACGAPGAAFTKYAFLAVKAFAQVRSTHRGRASGIRWADGENGDRGLQLLLYDEKGVLRQTMDLGGRNLCSPIEYAPAVASGSWCNLVLRGPAGANGGSVFHERLAVKRGWSFRVVGRIHAELEESEVRPEFYFYYDDYQLRQGASTSSGEAESATDYLCGKRRIEEIGSALTQCPSPSECGVPVKATSGATCKVLSDETITGCGAASRLVDIYAVVTDSDLQTLTQGVRSGDSAQICSAVLRGDSAGRISLPAIPAGESGTAVRNESDCAPASGAQAKCLPVPAAADCPAAQMVRSQYASELGALERDASAAGLLSRLQNGMGSAGRDAAHPVLVGDFSRLPFSPQFMTLPPVAGEVFENWTNTDRSGRTVDCARPEVRTTPARQPLWAKQDAAWVPDWSSFDIVIRRGNETVPPPQETLDAARRHSVVTPVSLGGIFPFHVSGVPELPLAWPQLVDAKFECQAGAGSAPSLEDVLRRFAALSGAYPQAEDRSLRFDAAQTKLGEISLGRFDECGKAVAMANVPSCVKASRLVSAKCPRGRQDLGSYWDDEFPSGPPQCAGVESSRCFKVPEPSVGGETSSPTRALQAATGTAGSLAESVGYGEMRRVLPDVKAGCRQSGCGYISIGGTGDGGERAQIVASYRMPLSFPADVILGVDSIEVRHTKEEPWEALLIQN